MSSPSEFLTFFRAASRSTTVLQSSRQSIRSFGSAPARWSNEGVKTDKYPDSEHATNKKDKLDVQSDNSAKGREYVLDQFCNPSAGDTGHKKVFNKN